MNMAEPKNASVQRVREEHLAGIAALERACFAEPWSEQSLRLLLGQSAVGFVVLEDGKPVAYAGMMTVLDEGQITNVAVDPECRRRGYGRAVTEALLGYAAEQGIVTVTLEVRASNEAAIALYQSLGFSECGRRPHFYRLPTEDALLFTWTAT